MNRSGKHIFFSDLDGTLLTSDKKLGDRTRAALEAFIEAGNYFALSSGRAMDSVMAVQRELGLITPRIFLIACNGAQIYSCDKSQDIYRIGIEPSLIESIFALARKHHIHIHTYSDRAIVSPRIIDAEDQACLDFYTRVIHSPVVLTDDILSNLSGPPCKCIAIELKDRRKLEDFRDALSALVGDRITLLFSNPYYLEIFRSEAGKGSAVLRLCDHLGIPTANAIAAGDEENDISMLRAAGIGIAMKNGTQRVQAAADIVTRCDNDHDGLAEYLVKAQNGSLL